MSSKFNFRSKKGMSLAVSLTICLFLILITGGITTVAMLQHNETGSSMNTRQAYISAKGGLDTIKDALESSDITDLPSDSETKYYVFYYDEAGELCCDGSATSENTVRDLVQQYQDNGYEIVGGNGTYYKIENKDNKYKVTALNTTGKFNGNVSMNRGDLSFDAIIIKKYTVVLATEPPTPAPTEPPTPAPTEPPTPAPIEIIPNEPVPHNLSTKFIMVGQQTCLNDTVPLGQEGQKTPTTTGKTLNQYSRDQENGNFNSETYYIPYNENGTSGYGYSYFPIVYDRMIKCTSDVYRVSLSAVNEGIYMLGGMSGYYSVDQFYVYDRSNQIDKLGTVSYISQNTEYQQTFACKFLVIENNFVALGNNSSQCPLVAYKGTEFLGTNGQNNGNEYVVAYLPKSVTFYIISENESDGNHRKKIVEFTKEPGYYVLQTGKNYSGSNNGTLPLCNPNTWSKRIANADGSTDGCTAVSGVNAAYWNDFNMYSAIKEYYMEDTAGTPGEIHSGNQETIINYASEIIDGDGKFFYNKETSGHTESSSFSYPVYRENQHVFLSPNQAITVAGYYNWYCGRSFNFQWYRPFDLSVCADAHIKISAPNVVLTIGPAVDNVNGVRDENGNVAKVPVSNWIVAESGNSTFQFFGNKGTGAPTSITVMCGFNVKYIDNGETKQYSVKSGTYTGVPSGLNLFSNTGAAYFRNAANRVPLEVSANPRTISNTTTASLSNSASVVPASVTAQTTTIASIFNRVRSGLGLTPMARTFTDDDRDGTIDINQGHITDPVIVVDGKVNNLLYSDSDMTDDKIELDVGTSLSVQKKYDDTTVTYVEFVVPAGASGPFVIPCSVGEKLDLLNGQLIMDRSTDGEANYTVTPSDEEVKILKGYY